jgi:serine/threonine-protein kinase
MFSPAIDVWGLGVLLYTLLAGERPFHGSTVMEVLLAVTRGEVPSPRKIDLAVERDLDWICMKCLEKKPENRYPDALALAEDLRRFQQGEPITRPLRIPLKQRVGGWVRGLWGG